MEILRSSGLDSATGSSLCFAQKGIDGVSTKAGCLLVPQDCASSSQSVLIRVKDPKLAFAKASAVLHPRKRFGSGVHASSVVGGTSKLGADVHVGAHVSVGENSTVGDRSQVLSGARVGDHVSIGDDCLIFENVVIRDGSRIGNGTVIHSGAVIGADGFGFVRDGARGYEKFPQIGNVVIGDDVEIGANSCIDRGALDDTVLENGVKLDNLVQIGHNVHVGAHTAMAGCVGVAGSARIGAHCTVGGGAVVLGHLTLADHVHVSAASVVMRSILQPGQYSGVFPIDDNAAWEKNAATLRQLHRLRDRIRALERAHTGPST